MSDEQRFHQAARDYYDSNIGAEEYVSIAMDTGHDLQAQMDAIERIGQERIQSFRDVLSRMMLWVIAGSVLGLIIQAVMP